jgi:hypothetical protein
VGRPQRTFEGGAHGGLITIASGMRQGVAIGIRHKNAALHGA